MKPHEDNIRELLQDVVPAPIENCGPTSAAVIQMVRRERARRRNVRILGAVAIMLLAGGAYVSMPRHPAANPAIAASESQPRVVFRSIDDEELFALLKTTPTALMDWPNGDRTLLVLSE